MAVAIIQRKGAVEVMAAATVQRRKGVVEVRGDALRGASRL